MKQYVIRMLQTQFIFMKNIKAPKAEIPTAFRAYFLHFINVYPDHFLYFPGDHYF